MLLMPLLIAEPTLLISEESVWLEELLCVWLLVDEVLEEELSMLPPSVQADIMRIVPAAMTDNRVKIIFFKGNPLFIQILF